eukprot:gene9941-2123_t
MSKDELLLSRSPTIRAQIVCFGKVFLPTSIRLLTTVDELALVSGLFVGIVLFSSYERWLILVATLGWVITIWPETQTCQITRSNISRTNTPLWSLSRSHTFLYNASEACSVHVYEEAPKYGARGSQVVIDMEDGSEVLVTSYCYRAEPNHHLGIAQQIASFLDIPIVNSDMKID